MCVATHSYFDDTTATEIYTLSLHDALPIWPTQQRWRAPLREALDWLAGELHARFQQEGGAQQLARQPVERDRKSTRLNSSHRCISYAVFCLKKKMQHTV